MEHKIPQAVIDAAKDMASFGGKLIYIGNYKGSFVYTYVYDVEMTIGIPELYLYRNNKATVVREMRALDILSIIS